MSDIFDPRKDPARRCLRLEEWPTADQLAWRIAVAPGDVLDPGGAGAAWAPHTRAGIISAYGRWLTWLRIHAHLDAGAAPEHRATPKTVAAYVEDLQRINASSTVLLRIRSLACALNAMVPGMNWDWLWKIGSRLKRKAHPVRTKSDHLVPQATLLALGRRLMADAESRREGAASRRAVRYRDGLMIALLAARPLRRRNFTAIQIGRNLVRSGAGYVLLFGAEETKTGAPLEFLFPAILVAELKRYLDHYRPVLVGQADTGRRPRGRGPAANQLWVSREGSAMSEAGVYDRIVKLTAAGVGRRLNPHQFRHCAATSTALQDPTHLDINKSILGHTTIATSERYYNRGQALVASASYQDQIAAMHRNRTLTKMPEQVGRQGRKG